MVLVCFSTTLASAANVLLLGDTDAETQVRPALESAGHTVTFGGIYYDWNGVSPNPASFDFIVVLNGADYGYDFTAGAKTAMKNFVQAGKGMLFTEWTAYDVGKAYKSEDPTGGLLPVTYDGGYGYGDTWSVVDPGDPLVAGVPANWYDPAGYSDVVAKPGTRVLVTGTGGNPLFSYSTENGGPVFHLNEDMTYTATTVDPNAMRLLVNAVGAPVPTMSRWGTLILLALLGLSAVYALRRRQRA
jgi:hypothetical protein